MSRLKYILCIIFLVVAYSTTKNRCSYERLEYAFEFMDHTNGYLDIAEFCLLSDFYYLCDMERGLRNNNPLNICKSIGTPWQGEIVPSADSRFAQFKSMAYGYRAAFKLLYNYQHTYGCKRLEDFIKRWAPPSENNTRAYIAVVANRSGLSDVSTIDTNNGDQMRKIVSAMSYMENGIPANEDDVMEGWKLFMS